MTDPHHPLTGCTTLILRPEGRAAPLITRITHAGGHTVTAPLITREPITTDQRATLDTHTAALHTYAWVAVTSVNAVDELIASIQRTHPTTPLTTVCATTQWASVGPATTRALRAHGITVAWEATENSASGMLAQWPAANTHTDPRTAVLLPLGNLATTQLETGLTSAGYTPTRVTTYLTVAHPAPPSALAAWRAGRIDAVILTSGSIVEQFVAQFGHPSPGPGPAQGNEDRPVFVAIGEPTRRAAQRHALPIDAVARQASTAGLVDALVDAWTARTLAQPEGTL